MQLAGSYLPPGVALEAAFRNYGQPQKQKKKRYTPFRSPNSKNKGSSYGLHQENFDMAPTSPVNIEVHTVSAPSSHTMHRSPVRVMTRTPASVSVAGSSPYVAPRISTDGALRGSNHRRPYIPSSLLKHNVENNTERYLESSLLKPQSTSDSPQKNTTTLALAPEVIPAHLDARELTEGWLAETVARLAADDVSEEELYAIAAKLEAAGESVFDDVHKAAVALEASAPVTEPAKELKRANRSLPNLPKHDYTRAGVDKFAAQKKRVGYFASRSGDTRLLREMQQRKRIQQQLYAEKLFQQKQRQASRRTMMELLNALTAIRRDKQQAAQDEDAALLAEQDGHYDFSFQRANQNVKRERERRRAQLVQMLREVRVNSVTADCLHVERHMAPPPPADVKFRPTRIRDPAVWDEFRSKVRSDKAAKHAAYEEEREERVRVMTADRLKNLQNQGDARQRRHEWAALFNHKNKNKKQGRSTQQGNFIVKGDYKDSGWLLVNKTAVSTAKRMYQNFEAERVGIRTSLNNHSHRINSKLSRTAPWLRENDAIELPADEEQGIHAENLVSHHSDCVSRTKLGQFLPSQSDKSFKKLFYDKMRAVDIV